MFIIIGGDGKEYGPASANQLRAWISAGRANLETRAKVPGTDEWRRLGDYAEFDGSIATPPPLPGVPPLPRTTIDTRDLASRGARTGAAVVNAVIYLLATMPGTTLMTRRLLEQNPDLASGGFPHITDLDLTGFVHEILWVWAGLVTALLLQSLLIALRGQNIGKLILGVRVVRITDGGPVGFGRGALLRFLLPVAVMFLLNATTIVLGFVFLFVDYCFIFREDQRCLHDLLAGTKVVRA